jgi:hypothetical protein
MRRRSSSLGLFVAFIITSSVPVWGQSECKIPPLLGAGVSPNILIVLDTSGSMLNVIWDSHFNSTIQYHLFDQNGRSDSLLPVTGDQVVFAQRDPMANPSDGYVRRDTRMGRVRLEYSRVKPGTTDISDGIMGTVESDLQGFFHFDRAEKRFIDASEFDSGNPNHIKVFLPYASYGEGPLQALGTPSEEAWYTHNYQN